MNETTFFTNFPLTQVMDNFTETDWSFAAATDEAKVSGSDPSISLTLILGDE